MSLISPIDPASPMGRTANIAGIAHMGPVSWSRRGQVVHAVHRLPRSAVSNPHVKDPTSRVGRPAGGPILASDRYPRLEDWITMSAPPRRGKAAPSTVTPPLRAGRTAHSVTQPGTAGGRRTQPTSRVADRRSGLRVGIIGVGRVGAVLGAALQNAGHRVLAVSAVSAASIARRDSLLPEAAVRNPDRVGAGTDVLLLAVPDDSLSGLVRGLAEADAFAPGQVVVHTSGAHGLSVLEPAVTSGARPLALHPAMTFTGQSADLERLRAGISFGATAPDELRPFATRLVADLGGSVEWLAESDRPLYHAALAHGANHLSTLVNEAMDRLRDAGIVHPERVLRPLLQASLANTLALGDAALTGPIARGDAGTVAKHVATIGQSAPDSLPVYLALARRTADRAIASGQLRAVDAEPLLDVLAQASPNIHSGLPADDHGAA
jgi:predicted short-subunit dehydrogenase-like oxidoreductase (DUF2520 family)